MKCKAFFFFLAFVAVVFNYTELMSGFTVSLPSDNPSLFYTLLLDKK